MDRAACYTRRVLVVFTAVLGAATVVGFLYRGSWGFETSTPFRLQYAGVLLVVGVLALALRRPRLAAAAIVLAAVNVAVIAPWQGASLATASAGSRTLRIVSFNVDADNHRYHELGPLIAHLRPDILGLI